MPAGYQSAIIGAQGDGPALTLVAAASVLPGQAKITLPANFIDVVGKKIDVGDEERVDVMVAELDERTEVVIVPKSAA